MREHKLHLRAHREWRIVGLVLCTAALQACATEYGAGFYLPEGDANRGRQAVAELKCQSCHDIKGLESAAPLVGATRVKLGGQTDRIKTYGDLVTSIVNPSHRIARDYPRSAVTTNGVSSMNLAYLNGVMTVQQLVDLVAFLQSEYEVVPPPSTPYWEKYPTNDPDAFIHGPPP